MKGEARRFHTAILSANLDAKFTFRSPAGIKGSLMRSRFVGTSQCVCSMLANTLVEADVHERIKNSLPVPLDPDASRRCGGDATAVGPVAVINPSSQPASSAPSGIRGPCEGRRTSNIGHSSSLPILASSGSTRLSSATSCFAEPAPLRFPTWA